MAEIPQDESTLGGMIEEAGALDSAITRAQGELSAMSAAARDADRLAAQSGFENCTVHEVAGVGRYAIPTQDGWAALLDIVHDRSVDINFSPAEYPIFDRVIREVTGSGYLDDPDLPKYDSATYRNLRDNLAAVRNFLIQTYYDPSSGMSGVDAQRALKEIAQFVGEGISNNLRLFGVVPNHDPTKPFIALDQASEPHGSGAQYIYEQILRHQRQSSWMRPFDAVLALFGGKKRSDWKLPAVTATPFLTDPYTVADKGHLVEDAIAARLMNLQNERTALQESMEQTELAIDMETMGNQLLATADRLNDISQLSEPVQDRAIEIARDILRKLRITIGGKNLLDGLNLTPRDDRAALGGITGVANVYERVLAWGRGIDPSIAQHPSIVAATQAVGQLGYLAKLEALRVATTIGNGVLADRIASRIAALPEIYKNVSARNFGELLNRVEGGIDTVLNRIQAIQGPGAAVGHSPAKQLGSYMNSAPIAGLASTLTSDGSNRDASGKRNMEVLAAEEAAAQANANRIHSQNADRARRDGQPAPTSTRSRGRAAVQQAQVQQQQQQRRGTPVNVNLNAMSAQQRAAWLRQYSALHAHDHEHDEHDHQPIPQKFDPRLMNPQMTKIKADLARSGINTSDMMSQKDAFAKMKNAATQGLPSQGFKPTPVPNLKAAPPKQPATEEEQIRQQQLIDAGIAQPAGPKGPGHTR